MPILIFAMILLLMAIFWESVVANIAIIGSLATAFAFLATAWTAFEARSSAKAAMKAVKLTSDSLLEMRKASFKQWLELLLDQHDSILEEVKKLLDSDNEIKMKLDFNRIHSMYSSLTKKPTLIKYANHVYSILNYIDKDFYAPAENIEERKKYVEHLSNRIGSDVKLMIAVLGLNVDNNKTYNPEKLNFLLNKYDFFEKEHFFKKALENINFLGHFVIEIFNKEYRRDVEFYVNKNLLNYNFDIINPIEQPNFSHPPKITFAVIWAYNNLCRGYLEDAFEAMPGYIRNGIYLRLTESLKEKNELEDIMSSYIGYNISGPGVQTKFLKRKMDITTLLNGYLKDKSSFDLRTIRLSNSSRTLYLDQFTSEIKRYELNNALLRLNLDSDKDKIINEIMDVVNKILTYYKAELETLRFQRK